MLFTDHTQCVSYPQTSVASILTRKKALANGLTIKALHTFMKQWLNNMNIKDKMDLLGIQDVTTNRQHRNGTVVWRLPIKNKWKNGSFIEVASFSTGYVRNQNSGYSNYQLNKRCESKPQYYKLSNGDYRKYTTRACELIPKEIDRLEYLITYCLKNYYIKNANQVINGDYIPKWQHEYEINELQNKLATINRISSNE